MNSSLGSKETVTILGTGITSLMVAFKLCKENYEVTIYTKGPDPRINRDDEQYSSTGNGRMGRFITGFEGEPYLSDTPMYPQMQWAFTHPISEGGWLAKPIEEFSKKDQDWLQKRYDAVVDHGKVKTLFEDYYVNHNRSCIKMWQELYEEYPELFKSTDVSSPYAGVLRLYDSQKLYYSTQEMHQKYGFLKESLSSVDVAERFPVYEEACSNGLVAGGIMAEGFSLNILQFTDNLITHLEQRGVILNWNCDMKAIVLDSNNFVKGLKTGSGDIIKSDHYSINPGAYGIDLLENTPAKGKLGGVAGRWLIMPRPEGYDVPTKIHGDKRAGFPVTDNNLTPFILNGKRMLAVGGGYVYVGSDEKNYSNCNAYKIVDAENERTVELYLGEFYKNARNAGLVSFWPKACVRSFTYDDEPIHEIMPTANGGYLTITAGSNTGTTTLAPFLAEWTFKSLKGKTECYNSGAQAKAQ